MTIAAGFTHVGLLRRGVYGNTGATVIWAARTSVSAGARRCTPIWFVSSANKAGGDSILPAVHDCPKEANGAVVSIVTSERGRAANRHRQWLPQFVV